ncbi:MAG: type II secretion system ATPase GspE [Alphaproteobacteria bacterium]|nr:type II secretion system ATPase GspE [Alphaproteobacteria bacterium]
MARELTDILLSRGKIDRGGVQRATHLRSVSGEPIHHILPRLGLVSEEDMAQALAESLGLGIAASADFPPRPILADRVAVDFLRQSRVLPIAETNSEIRVAMADPLDSFAIEALRLLVDKAIRPVVAVPAELERQIDRLYGDGRAAEAERLRQSAAAQTALARKPAEAQDVERLKDLASGAPVIRLVNRLIAEAVTRRASDIHVEPFEGSLRLRFRIDGALRPIEAPPPELHPAIVSRVKVMAGLDIVERRLAQDGRCKTTVEGRDIDLRVSIVPTLHGESVVLRILDRAQAPLDLGKLGFTDTALQRLTDGLGHGNGIVLVTGPTGSGKTTTLYAGLQRLNGPERKIVTVEDPVEYQLPGVNQIQVNQRIGLGFASILRSVLRHDPDVIMVGEIRDVETARIAVQAALTGHLVLSTLHTNSAAGAITRLIDMGVENYLLTSSLRAIVAQRLVRTLCPHCRTPYAESAAALRAIGLAAEAAGAPAAAKGARPPVLYRAKGCERCAGSGYLGRSSVAEVLPITDRIRRLILERSDAIEIERAARGEGMRTMREDGLAKALAGQTTLEEVLRVTQAE